MSIAKRIRDLRYVKGMGADELASRAEISRTALYQIESGRTETPRAGTLSRIARALGVSIESLLLGETGRPLDFPADRVNTTLPLVATAGGRNVPRHFDADVADGLRDEFDAEDEAASFLWRDDRELFDKFRTLLASPLSDGAARLVEDLYRLLPVEHRSADLLGEDAEESLGELSHQLG